MNAREVIAEAIRYGGRATAINKALFVIAGLRARGFVILPRSEVEAIRDKALEEAAEIAQYIPTPADVQDHALRLGYISASQAIAAAIRKLKSGGSQPR